MSEARKSIGERIKELRLEKALTQKDVANHIGRTAAAVTQWELGITEPNGQSLVKLADLLGCEPQWILTGKQTKSKSNISKWDGVELPRCPIVQWHQISGLYDGSAGISHLYINEWMPVVSSGENCVIVKSHPSFFPNTNAITVPEGSMIVINIREPFSPDEFHLTPGKYYVFKHINSSTPVIKLVDFDGTAFILIPLTPTHPTYSFTSGEWEILGDVEQIIITL